MGLVEEVGELSQALQDLKQGTLPDSQEEQDFMKIVEKLGDLSHALLKLKQGIRGTPDELEDKARDAVGDILIYLMNFCSEKEWDMAAILQETWKEVSERDWILNNQTGRT